ncbi:hypothetical protein WA577_001514 [Blastocystis sp. JDR]
MQPTLPPTQSVQSMQGRVFELATDCAGSRVLQQLVDAASPSTLRSLLREVQLQLGQLLAHPVGSLFFQRLLERGDDALRDSILESVQDCLVATSFNAQGTHSVQLIVSICQSPAQIGLVLQALHGHVAQLASHANGTHVIQRCVQCYPPAHCAAFYQEIIDGCVDMSTHRHGCCVVQRFFTTVPPAFQQELADAIARHSRIIIPSPFGNYVVQHIMEHGSREQAVQLGRCVLGNVVLFCCQKYSSNVVEKAILLNDDELTTKITEEIVASQEIEMLLHHSYGNYVIQRLLRTAGPSGRSVLLEAIHPFESELGKSTGGRHVLSLVQELVHS